MFVIQLTHLIDCVTLLLRERMLKMAFGNYYYHYIIPIAHIYLHFEEYSFCNAMRMYSCQNTLIKFMRFAFFIAFSAPLWVENMHSRTPQTIIPIEIFSISYKAFLNTCQWFLTSHRQKRTSECSAYHLSNCVCVFAGNILGTGMHLAYIRWHQNASCERRSVHRKFIIRAILHRLHSNWVLYQWHSVSEFDFNKRSMHIHHGYHCTENQRSGRTIHIQSRFAAVSECRQ